MTVKKEQNLGRRKAIRDEIQTLLKGNTDAGDRVYTNPSISVWEENLPVVAVYTRAESAEKFNNTELKRTIALAIEIFASGTEDPLKKENNVEDALDEMCDQVERYLSKADALGCSEFDEIILTDTQYSMEDNGSKTIGAARLTFNATYYTEWPRVRSDVASDDFDGADAQWKVGHNGEELPGDVVDAEDNVDVIE